jgi:hypothetical protein
MPSEVGAGPGRTPARDSAALAGAALVPDWGAAGRDGTREAKLAAGRGGRERADGES